MSILYEARDLTKRYQGRTVLSLPELQMEQERIYALQGPNGSGKTTLLEILALLIPPSSGQLFYQGRVVDYAGARATALRREMIMVHQNPVLFTTTVKKNLEFGLKVRRMSAPLRERIIMEALDLVGMRGFLQAPAHKLSGGETQRVAIARALACSPKVLLFDEPTSSVDVENRMIIERIIRDIHSDKRMSVVFTSHDLTQASRLSHEVIPLFEGKRTDSLPENIFSAMAAIQTKGPCTYVIQEDVLLVGKEADHQGKVRISIDPFKLMIYKGKNGVPHGNRLRGRLFQLTDQHPFVRAAVDVGILIHALLPRESFKEQALHIGDEVTLIIPGDAIHVFE